MSTNVWRVWAYKPDGSVVPISTAGCQDFEQIEYAQQYAHDITQAHPDWTVDIVQHNVPASARSSHA